MAKFVICNFEKFQCLNWFIFVQQTLYKPITCTPVIFYYKTMTQKSKKNKEYRTVKKNLKLDVTKML